ncbi:THO complex subunit 2 [Fopius arisanus]|uniref:THO complex subunit 2 n=1 Tax=Fopius arisanus TaxID=64838 RepID=A0A0C9Q024_9HYME|nr:PREDICTED: THO complex subunit 2-like [Fopius arisanus]
MVFRRKMRASNTEEAKNTAVVLEVKDKETVINANLQGKVGVKKSPGGNSPVGIRRSSRRRKEPAKYFSPSPSPGPSRVSIFSKTPESSQTEADSDDTEEKTPRGPKKAIKKKRKIMKLKKEQISPKMTDYEKMIQKNIREREAFLAHMLKREGNSFEEEKNMKTSRKTKRRDSSTNDDEEIVQQPKRRKKEATRKRKATSDNEDGEESDVGHNTRSRGAAKRSRGIYEEHGSSGGDDTLPDGANVDEGSHRKRKTRSYEKARSNAVVTKGFALLAEKREVLRAKRTQHVEGGSLGNEQDTGKSDDDTKDEDCVGGDFSSEEQESYVDDEPESRKRQIVTPGENLKDNGEGGEDFVTLGGESQLGTPEKSTVFGEKIEKVESDNQNVISSSQDNIKNCGGSNSDEGMDPFAERQSNVETSHMKESGNSDETEEEAAVKERKERKSKEFLEENKENSLPEEAPRCPSPGE